MGYRYYMFKISNDVVKEIKSMSLEQLEEKYKEDGEDYFYIDNLPTEEIYEFGKLYFDDTAQRIYSKGVPLFENTEVMEELSDYVPYVVGKEGLLEAIEIYKSKVINYYKSLLIDDKDGIANDKQEEHIKGILREWERGLTLNLNDNKETLTHSRRYEYRLFELVRLLKTIDFEKNTIVFYGR